MNTYKDEAVRVREIFMEISRIPRPSCHEERIADYICGVAKENNCEYYRDEYNNVLVNVPATEGCEDREAILLQGHTDMVCEKNDGVEHDFMSCGIDVIERDGSLTANGTTLGADNGVAVAFMLYVIEGGISRHPAIQCLFTSMEEVGLLGVKEFDFSRIFARRMINMDGNGEGTVIAGCAGGMRSNVVFTPKYERYSGKAVKIRIDGLRGGHSGEDIAKGRSNANVLMAQLLSEISAVSSVRLADISGGDKDNAIPRLCEAVAVLGDFAAVRRIAESFEQDVRSELCADDASFSLTLCETEAQVSLMDSDTSKNIISFMSIIQNGVLEMSKKLSGLVEYSRTLSVVKHKGEEVTVTLNTRSAIDRQIDISERQIDALAALCSARTLHASRYSGWRYDPESKLLKEYIRLYGEIFGKEIKEELIHAGLECATVKALVPDMDCISCGPDMVNLHSPEEALDIASFDRFSAALSVIIERL